MKFKHLLRVEHPADVFTPLIAAVADAGGRAGWLELEPPEVPRTQEPAAAAGVLRAVAVGGGRSVAVKPLRGAPVLRDLLREHFRGTAVVLVRGAAGEDDVPLLEPTGDGWRLDLARTAKTLTTADLVAALRRPHPWGSPPEPPPAEEPAGPKRRRERRAELRAERAKAKRRKKRS